MTKDLSGLVVARPNCVAIIIDRRRVAAGGFAAVTLPRAS